uniref:Uncharacterized protein n=1 Tax=Romanomermis culicivorax TaxID=13658 RepID=A0A915KMA7_ROMCU
MYFEIYSLIFLPSRAKVKYNVLSRDGREVRYALSLDIVIVINLNLVREAQEVMYHFSMTN